MSERLSRERIEEIAARAEAATEGPWEVGGGGGAHMDGTRDWYTVDCPWNERTKYRIGLAAMQLPEAEFVAHAREDVPALLAHIAALEEENERLNQLSVDLRACMVEARHKLGWEQDKNDKLWAVAEAARKVSSYTRTEPVDDIVNVLDALDDALAALGEEVGE